MKKLKKRLGQHLLKDAGIQKRIAEASGAGPGTLCLEVGPGMGDLTSALLETGAKVVAVEIDPSMIAELYAMHGEDNNLDIVRGDILRKPLEELVPAEHRPAFATGNLPYYISSPIIFRLLENRELFERITVLVQKEVGARMAAAPGSSDYGPLSVFCAAEADGRVLFAVPREAFTPQPKADSCVVSLVPKRVGATGIKCRESFGRIVRGAFEYRRKTSLNSLRTCAEKGSLKDLFQGFDGDIKLLVEEALENAGIAPSARPQEIPVSSFITLSNFLCNKLGIDPSPD